MEQLTITNKHTTVLSGIILSFFLVMFATLCIVPLLRLTGNQDNLQLFIISRLFIFLCLFIVFSYCLKVEKQRFLLWEDHKYSISFYLLSIVILLLTLFGISMIVGLLIKLSGLFTASKKLNEMIQIMASYKPLIVFGSVTAGVTEELIFRGYLIPRLQLFFTKAYWPIIISSLLFGFAHIGYGTITQVILPCFIGLIFALYYNKYRNIKVLIICHSMWDLLILFLGTQ